MEEGERSHHCANRASLFTKARATIPGKSFLTSTGMSDNCVGAVCIHVTVMVAGDALINREVKHDVNGRRQTAEITSDFESFSSKP